jgi:hemoglobin
MKKTIQSRKDIEILVKNFYDKVINDEMIGFIFNDVAKVNWDAHLPVMFDFWENVLLQNNKYSGNPMPLHVSLNQKIPLTKAHFDRWLKLFHETIDEYFEGDIATLAKQRSQSIATIMQIKIAESEKERR